MLFPCKARSFSFAMKIAIKNIWHPEPCPNPEIFIA
jgi:hypothetical protein